jgi:hypothetical protein
MWVRPNAKGSGGGNPIGVREDQDGQQRLDEKYIHHNNVYVSQ